MPDTNDSKEILQYAADVRKFEIELFWKRSTFFWAFSTTAIGAYGFAPRGSGLQFAAGCFGLVCAVIWTLVNRGSKYWQEVWEKKVEAHQLAAIRLDLFSRKSNQKIPQSWKWKPMHYSVSALATAFSDFTIIVWMGLILRASGIMPHIPRALAEVATLLVTGVFICAVLFVCSRNERFRRKWLRSYVKLTKRYPQFHSWLLRLARHG